MQRAVERGNGIEGKIEKVEGKRKLEEREREKGMEGKTEGRRKMEWRNVEEIDLKEMKRNIKEMR